jgi:thiosulfate/3-mercaptopyruvate sulfurtransferase
VNADSQVVAYDESGGIYAARLWWMMRWLGHEAAAVLDGGWRQWLAEGRPTSRATTRAAKGKGDFAARSGAGHVDALFLLARLGDNAVQVVDARAHDRFRGENETLDPVAGHIPGSINRPYGGNLDATGRFKPAAQLRSEFQALLGGRPPAGVVHQCGSGVTACHNLLAMEIAGLAGSRLYPGSWSEWCADPSRPVARGEAPGG